MSEKLPGRTEPDAGAKARDLQGDRLFLAFMENMPAAAWIKDLDGRYLFVNERVAQGARRSAEEIIGMTDDELWPPDTAAQFKANDREVLETGQPRQMVETALQPDHLAHLLVTKFPIHDKDGAPQMMGGVGVDITEFKAAEEALRASEETSSALLNATSEVVYLLDREGTVLSANVHGAKRLGWTPQELVGVNIYALLPPEVAAFRKAKALEVIRTGKALRFEDTRAGRVLETCVYPLLNTKSEVARLAVFANDVTEARRTEQALRESEERYRRLVESSPFLVGAAVDGKVAFINRAGARMLGAESPEGLLGRPVIDFVHPTSRGHAAGNIQRILQAGDAVRLGVETWQRLDGALIKVELSAFPFRYQGAPAIYIVAEDVTDRIRTEEKLQTSAAQLQSVSRDLVVAQEAERARIARELHDVVGQSLTALQLNLQSALRAEGSSPVAGYLQEGLGLVNDLVQRTQDMSLSLRPSLLDDIGLPAALRWFTHLQADRAGLRAEFWASPMEGRLDATTETTCFRVAQEALANVARHAQATELTVELRCEENLLHLVVYDNGKGFDAAAALARTGPEASLGLLGMQERVSLAGGRFECRSNPDQGTQIHAWLPLKWRPAAAQPDVG